MLRRTRPRFDRLEDRSLLAITIDVRYTFDLNNFFNTQAKRDVMQLAADALEATLNDRLNAIVPAGGNTWSAVFLDPSSGNQREVGNLVVPADTIVLYVGGYNLPGTESGFGGPGGFNAFGSQDWLDNVRARGQGGGLLPVPTDFGPWGGSIAFDTVGTPFYFGTNIAGIQPGQTDFFSVALHEIGHVLGIGDVPFGDVSAWTRHISNNAFTGPNARAAFNNQNVPLEPGGGHWAVGVRSGNVEAAMTPTILQGTRKTFTPLDFAGLRDVGWVVQEPPTDAVRFNVATASAGEGAGQLVLNVTRSVSTTPATVQFSTINGSASAGLDFQTASGTLSFAVGESSKTITVPILNDAAIEPNEIFTVTLSAPSGTTLATPSQATVTILDDDQVRAARFGDFDGDFKADIAVYRPNTATWLVLQSALGPRPQQFGAAFVDVPLQGDFDADGRLDFALFRPTSADWIILQSTAGPRVQQFGAAFFDIPVPADYDGDGRTDLAVFRPATAQWFILQSTAGPRAQQFGAPNVDRPIPADYDGDGKADLAVFRPTSAHWFILQSSLGPRAQVFGGGADAPIPADYDGDGKADLATFRSTSADWFILNSTGGTRNQSFGAPLVDVPVPADYDGDGRTDLAVFRPPSAQWFILQSTAGPRAQQFGAPGVDVPLPTPLAFRYRGGLVRGASSRAATAAPLVSVEGASAILTAPKRRRAWPRPTVELPTAAR